jgi:hypothetical protein
MQPIARTGGPRERRCEEKHDGLYLLLEVQPPEDVAQPALAEAEDHRHRDVQLRSPVGGPVPCCSLWRARVAGWATAAAGSAQWSTETDWRGYA